MRNYELIILISPNLIEQESFSLQKEIADFIESKEGKILRSSDPIKRILGHKIENNLQAYIAELEFSINPELLEEIEKKIKEKKEIVRHMLLIKRPESEKKKKRSSLFKKPVLEKNDGFAPEGSLSDKPSVKPSRQKVSLGDIDKKIDEILSE